MSDKIYLNPGPYIKDKKYSLDEIKSLYDFGENELIVLEFDDKKISFYVSDFQDLCNLINDFGYSERVKFVYGIYRFNFDLTYIEKVEEYFDYYEKYETVTPTILTTSKKESYFFVKLFKKFSFTLGGIENVWSN